MTTHASATNRTPLTTKHDVNISVAGHFDQPADEITRAGSVADVEAALDRLKQDEGWVKRQLNEAAAAHKYLAHDIARIDILRAQVGSLVVSTRSISNIVISNASSTASKISGAVKRLDVEQSRVKSTLDVVELVSELKTCVLGVTGSMGAPQDWETAAAYLNRAFKIPRDIIDGNFAEKIVPTAEVPDPPNVTLAHAAESLRILFLREFEKAASEGNGGKVTRFFKLFPLIGKPEVGLEVYGRYVCQGVASRAGTNLNAGTGGGQQKEKLFFANALTKLFEHIAQIIDNHGALVERHYGLGRMVKVIEKLQVEADIQGGIILETWSDERKIDRKLTDTKSYAFTFLVQSFLPAPAPKSGIPRVGSPAIKGSVSESSAQEDETIDMKEVDSLMSEMTLMLGRWSLYTNFIATKCDVPENETNGLQIPPLLANSTLRRRVADRIIAPFNAMTAFFFRRSVEKAFQLDEPPLNLTLDERTKLATNPPYITSAVDDVMYIVSQTLDKTLHTSQKPVIASILPTISRVLSSDFIGMIQRKMRDESYPKAAVQGALPPEDTTITFLVLINNLDVAVDYTRRIVEARIEPISNGNRVRPNSEGISTSLSNLFPLDHDASYVRGTLRAFESNFDAKASELIGDGIFVAFKNIVKPRLRPILADTFRDVDYQMTQEELEQAHAMVETEGRRDSNSEGVVQENFRNGWDLLTRPIFRILTDRNAAKLLVLMVSYLSEALEKRIWSYYGRLDSLGGARLERDIASIVNAVVRGGKYRLRESFAKCTQICIVMNMEDDEWEGLNSTVATKDGDIQWQLNADERPRARTMIRSRV